MPYRTSGKPIKKRKNEGRISLYPLSVEQALSLFMKADPKKVERAIKRKKVNRKKNNDTLSSA